MCRRRKTDDRAISESLGVAILVIITLAATLSVALSAILVAGQEDEDEFGTDVSFDHIDNLKELLVFYDDGDDLVAGRLHLDGPDNNVTWAELKGVEPDATVSPGDQPARLSKQTAYGENIGESAVVEVVYNPPDGEQLVLATWRGEEAEDGGNGESGPGGGTGDEGPGGGTGDDGPGQEPGG